MPLEATVCVCVTVDPPLPVPQSFPNPLLVGYHIHLHHHCRGATVAALGGGAMELWNVVTTPSLRDRGTRALATAPLPNNCRWLEARLRRFRS